METLNRRPNVYEIMKAQRAYPVHAQTLQARFRHVKTRMMERFGMSIGFGTYLKITEICGKALGQLIKENESFRFPPLPSNTLGSKYNPKYAMTCILHDQKFRVVYDAHDRMLLTVFYCGTFDPHRAVRLTEIGFKLGKEGEVEYFKETI